MSNPAVVQSDSYLTLHYRIVLIDGPGAGTALIDTFDDRPATLQMGAGQWSPEMEATLLGRAEGESFTISLLPEQAYGERNPELLQWLSLDAFWDSMDEHAPPSPGDLVNFDAPYGGQYSGVFKELTSEGALFDFNHPLAGRSLRLDVNLIGVI